MVTGVAAEAALVDLAVGRSIERKAPVLQLDHRVDRFPAHEDRGRLIDQVVATFDRVEGVPFGVVLLHVSERGAHASLGRPRVRTGGVQLRHDARPDRSGGLESGSKAGPAGSDDHRVIVVEGGHR